ncbi:MAG TPA: efflux transporter outer membrane subunit [Flavipsychrobacter sp.]|nr:efflux transporter outer membrane subunit [Flavipsychrobacter sp.]
MQNRLLNKTKEIIIICLSVSLWGCTVPRKAIKDENKTMPASYLQAQDTATSATVNWRTYFGDETLIALIDTALMNNQELNIVLQEMEVRKNEIRARKGEYLPSANIGVTAGVEKSGKYTRYGAIEEQLEVKKDTRFPEPLSDYFLGMSASWEIDIWKKLRQAQMAAVMRYLASTEGKNFAVTNLVADIAEAYYELLALDNELEIIQQNVGIQTNVLRTVRQQKEAARVTQLAVNRFEAQLLKTQNYQYAIRQRIVETENRINYLTARFPQPIPRASKSFNDVKIDSIQAGIPSQLLTNRPDIRQAEYELAAKKLDVKVARANFYPSLRISASAGFQAFNVAYLLNPHSILYNLAGDLMVPLINKNALHATYNTATAQQLQAVYKYQQTILNAYVEVLNQLTKIETSSKSYETKQKEVETLTQSVNIANNLFNSARADYSEVLLTQREALETKMELVEIKAKQLNAKVNIYKALGGGWR